MPHTKVIQAKAVLADPDSYPEIVVSYATLLVKWSDEKRIAMQWLWTHRVLLKTWIEAREGKTEREQSRAATRKLSTKISRDHLNDFHKAHNYLGGTEVSMGVSFGIFNGLLQTLRCQDVALMCRYFACVNAQRIDETLAPVAFLRWVTGTAANEVLAWRLLRQGKA